MIIHSCLDNDESPSGGLRSLWIVVSLPSGLLPEVKSGVSRFLRGNLSFAFRGDVVCVLQNMSFEFFPGLYAG